MTDSLREWARKSTQAPTARHIAIDLDDVLLDFTGGLRSAVSQQFGVEVPEFREWHISDVLNPIVGRNWWSWMKDNVDIWAEFDPVEGGLEALEDLRKAGYYLEIVTSKPTWAEYNVWRWLAKHEPPVQRVTIVGQHDKKVDFTKASILVDDKPGNILEWILSGRHGILFGRPHNEGFKSTNPRIHRASGWPDVRALIEVLT